VEFKALSVDIHLSSYVPYRKTPLVPTNV